MRARRVAARARAVARVVVALALANVAAGAVHGVTEATGSALSGRRAAATGTQEALIMVTHPSDVAVDQAKLTKVYKTQTEAYFAWASYGTLALNVSVFFHQLGTTEKDGSTGLCNPHPDASTSDGVGYNPWDASADFQEVYNSYAGDPGTNRNSDIKHMRTFMHLTNTCTGTCDSNTDGIICTQPYSSVTACADADSTTELCDTTVIHELLHAIGLKYHSGGYKCKQSDYDDSTTTWRLCEYKDYGGVFDVLGSGSDTYGKKMAWGVSSYLRWDMHWLSNDNVKVITKTNGRVDDSAPDESKTCTLSSLSVDTTTSSTTRACVVRFSDDTMSDLGTIWLELRSGNKFDHLVVHGEHSGFNSLGVLGYHEGNKLIDFYPYAADSTDAAKYDDWEQTALRSTENGGVWIDSVSGLKLTAAAFDSSSQTITVTVTFGQPAECSKRGAKAYPSQFLGYWVWHVRMSDVAEQAKYYPSATLPDYPGGVSSIDDGNFESNYFTTSYFNQYIPYAGGEPPGIQYETAQQLGCYKVVLQYRMSVQNLDYGACAKSNMTVRGLNLPAGWRVDEGGCTNEAGAQAVVDDICFVVAVDKNTADGAYEIRIQAAQINYSDKAVMAATETVPLWVCVGGYNHYTQAWGNNAWTCDYGPVGSKTRVTGTNGTIHNRASSTYEASSTYYSTSDVSAKKSLTATHYTRNPDDNADDRLQSMSSIAIAGVSDDRCYQVTSTRYCAANYYVWSQYVCSACPPDSTRPAGDDSWLADGETQCSCPSGSVWSNGTCASSSPPDSSPGPSPSACGANYRVNSAGTCVACPSFSTNAAGDDPTVGETQCDCDSGYYLSGSTCVSSSPPDSSPGPSPSACGANYRVNSAGTCVACPSFSTNAAGDDPTVGETQCDCDSGYYLSGSTCVSSSPPDSSPGPSPSACGANYRVNSAGTCVACPSFSTNAAGDDPSGSETQCECDAGYYLSGSTCTQCSSGFATCTSAHEGTCAANYYVNGDHECAACPANSFNAAGDATASGASTCECDAGYYLSGSTCTQCSSGFATCTSAHEGTCAANYYVNGDHECAACPANSFNAAGDATASGASNCECDAGYYYLSGSTCTQCSSGFATCTSAHEGTCAANYYVNGDHECAACPANSFNAAGDATASGASTCECDAGYYLSGSTCTQCSSGFATCTSAHEGTCAANYRVSVGTCVACPSFSTNAAGDPTSGGETQCDCDSTYELSGSTCVSSSPPDSSPGPSPSACGANYRVNSAGTCVACPSFSTNAAGDDPSGGETQCDCNAGYSYHGDVGACVATCDASAAPANGGVGNCTSSLASGSTCQPTCNRGYAVSGPSSCAGGALTAATCASVTVPDIMTGTWVMTYNSTADSSWTHDEFTTYSNGSWIGRGWGWGGRNYTDYGDVTAVSCTTDAATGDIRVVINYWLVEDWNIGPNPYPSSSTTAGKKLTRCGYGVFAAAQASSKVYTANITTSGEVDSSFVPGVCPASADDVALNGISWMPTAIYNYGFSWRCVADCKPWSCAISLPCDASAAPANGGVGDCTSSLAPGSTCQPTCNSGYVASGPSSCAGNVLTAATCVTEPTCDASAAPANGGVGNCTSSLASGSTCQPTCNSGYAVSGPSSCDGGALTAATCGCANGYTLVNGVCVESTDVEVKVEFAGITQVIDDALVQTLQNALTTSLSAGATGVQVNPADITMKYTMQGKQTFPSPVDESAFIAAAATSLGVATSDIQNFAQSAARRRLLNNVVTYEVVTTNRTTVNAAVSAASSPISVGGVTGAGAAPTTTIAVEIKTAVPTSQASTVTATLNDPSFTTSVATSASSAGVSGISISSPPCTGLAPPAAGVMGTCGSELASGSSCQPTCVDGYTVSGPTTCIAGALTPATCSRDSGSLFGGFVDFVSSAGAPLFRIDGILFATVALGALLAP